MHRAILIGPVAFTLIGGAIGICWAMLYRQEPQERAHVYLDDSFPCLCAGAAAGFLVGLIVFTACARWPALLSIATVVIATLLGAGIIAPIGWIAGDSGIDRQPRQGMMNGAVTGAAIGLILGVLQWRVDRWRRPAEPSAAERGRSTARGGSENDNPDWA
jgi:hypothetical protein